MENWNKFLKEADEYPETALNSPGEAGRQWSYENIVNTVGDLAREALEGHGLDADSIRDAIAEALDEELGPVQDPDTTDNWRGNKNPLREDADDERDAEIEEATRDGKADGASGSEREGPGGHFQKYYDEAYDRATKKSK